MKNAQFIFSLLLLAFLMFSCQKNQQDMESLLPQNGSISQASTTTEEGLTRTCGSEEHMNHLMEDATYASKHREKLLRLKNAPAISRNNSSEKIVLPVAIHYQGVPNPDRACLIRLAQSQIAILNDDIQGTNGDRNKWNQVAFAFPDTKMGAANLSFQIADRNHPAGFGLAAGGLAVTINQTNGDEDTRWAGYLNIFVKFDTGILGYAPLGGSGNGDGVVIDATAFGAGAGCGTIRPNAPYNLGRTLTHEVGHYLLLDHIWGGGCSRDDGVADTPTQASANYNCPSVGKTSCNTKDLFMNYMDYVNDVCMYMFSQGQATRMTNYVNTSLQHVVAKAASVITPFPELDQNAYYRMTTKWQGTGKSLDVINDGKNNNVHLAKSGGYTGQFWKFTSMGNGYYRMTTKWQGTGKSLDVINDGKNNNVQLAKSGGYTGQFWKVTPIGGGYYRLTTYFQGAGKSLDVINDGKNNKVHLSNTGNYTGQFWKLAKL